MRDTRLRGRARPAKTKYACYPSSSNACFSVPGRRLTKFASPVAFAFFMKSVALGNEDWSSAGFSRHRLGIRPRSRRKLRTGTPLGNLRKPVSLRIRDQAALTSGRSSSGGKKFASLSHGSINAPAFLGGSGGLDAFRREKWLEVLALPSGCIRSKSSFSSVYWQLTRNQRPTMSNPVPPKNSANFEKVLAKLEDAAVDAVAALHASLFDCSASVRVRAAVAILSFGIISTEARDLDSRVAEFERLKWKRVKPQGRKLGFHQTTLSKEVS